MDPLPQNEACFRCHNRSGRIALTYQGLVDGNNALVPTVSGLPGPRMISEVRNVHSIKPDIHHEKGMECIDCHTSREIMGEGYTYTTMNHQLEVTCEDCHGTAKDLPNSRPIAREDDPPLKESLYVQKTGPFRRSNGIDLERPHVLECLRAKGTLCAHDQTKGPILEYQDDHGLSRTCHRRP